MGSDRGGTLIVDSDEEAREKLSRLLLRAGFSAVHASTGEEALAAARSEQPWLVLLDVCLPDVSGYVLCRELRDEFGEELAIVLLSGERTDSVDRTTGFLVGGDDYVVEPFDPGELLARVRRINERRGFGRNNEVRASGRAGQEKIDALTHRELEVLRLLAAGNRTREIASTLGISETTVASHLQRVLAKLGVNTRAQAVALAYRTNLV